MILEYAAVTIGLIISFLLKDINFLALNFIYPDFLMIFIIFMALRRGELSGIWLGFIGGLLEDSAVLVFSRQGGDYVHVIGVHMFFYTLVGYSLGKFNKLIDATRLFPIMGVVFVYTLVVRFCIWLVTGLISDFNSNYLFIGSAIYTALITPIWLWLLGWLYRPMDEEK